jgi:homoserine kinase
MGAMSSEAVAYAPGSTSNLGPGFDCLGLAFTGKGDRVAARRAPRPGVVVASVSDSRIPCDPLRNTAAIAATAVLRLCGSGEGLDLRVEKGLPISGGMGGSAASAVAGAVAADAVLEARLPREALLMAALEAEGVVAGRHADNVAPSLLGGCVLVQGVDPLRFATLRLHPDLGLVLVTPGYGVETAKARAVLPRELPRGEAVAQAAFLAGLVLGLERGDMELIRRSMVDRIAEPVRLPLYPGYGAARLAALEAGAAGVAVSGAGPTVVAVVSKARSGPVGAAMERAYASHGIACCVHEAEVDPLGARVVG